MQKVAEGIKDEDTVSTLGARLARLDKGLDEEGRQDFADAAEGKALHEVAAELLEATDPETWAAHAAEKAGKDPDDYVASDTEMDEAKTELIATAVRPLMKAEVRRRIESLREKHDQLVDFSNPDRVTFAGWKDAAQAKTAVEEFEDFVKEHHDEYLALKAYYQRPYRLRPSYDDVKELAKAIESPPLSLTPEKLWEAYAALDSTKVKGKGMQRTLTDLVQLVRFAMHQEDELLPRKEVVMLRFDLWLTEQESAGREFSDEQVRWLTWMADQIATSMSLEAEDFDYEPFAQEGGLLGAQQVFGEAFNELMDELNEELAKV